jgi:protein-S-isoprenylcysteine O-methyltransferase Ste14
MSAARTAGNVGKTLVFLLAFWAVFLYGIPIAISVVEIAIGIQRFPPMPLMAGVLLLVSTAIAMWAAMTLAIRGNGTPLALDPPRVLITSGPYAHMRHPFAAAATAQIVGLALALGSVPVLAYATVAMAVWYFAVRPHEEQVLDKRFGQNARDYRAHVRGFRPRLRPYKYDSLNA